jgi:signal transduction histidine kinase
MKTTVNHLIRKELRWVDAYQETDTIREYLINCQALLVIEKCKPMGLLTAVDLVKKKYPLIIDCLVPKPAVQEQDTVEEVLQVMKRSNFSVLPVQDAESNFVGAICIDDIVEFLYRKTEKQQAVVQSMVHDLKSPLANISSINEMLQQDIDPQENKELLSYVGLSVNLAREIINDLLLSEKLETEETILTKIELNELISSCIAPVKGLLAQKMIALKTTLLENPCYFMGDKIKLQRVIHNLLSNAIKFSHRESVIRISCSVDIENLMIEITDEGVGIPEALQPFVFDKFSKAQRKGTAGEGTTGLGMFITKEIVRLHQGEIWFKSEEEIGTIFFIRLPLNTSLLQQEPSPY